VNSGHPFAVIVACLAAGCSNTAQPASTMDLLQQGDVKVCIAPEVEDTVRRMILPKNVDTSGYTVSFSETTLEGFDKGVTKAACNANVWVSGPEGEVVPRTPFDFVIKPSAQDTSTFIVTVTGTGAITAQIATTIGDAGLVREEAKEQEAQNSALTALVKDGWLTGRWVEVSKGSNACYEGPYVDFERNHHLEGGGRWKLAGLQLSLITPSSSVNETITSADVSSFTSETADGTATNFRRCTRDDMAEPAGPYRDDEDAGEAASNAPAEGGA